MDVAAQFVGQLIVDGDTKALDRSLSLCRIVGTRGVHRLEAVLEHLDGNRLTGIACLDGDLLGKVTWSVDIQRGGKLGNLDGESTVVLGHSCIADITQGLQLNTDEGLSRGLISHDTLQGDGGIFVGNRPAHGLLDVFNILILFLVLSLSHRRNDAESEYECTEQQSTTYCLPKIKYSALHIHFFLASNSSSSTGFSTMAAMHTSRV